MPTETVFRQLPRLLKRGAVGTHTHTIAHAIQKLLCTTMD